MGKKRSIIAKPVPTINDFIENYLNLYLVHKGSKPSSIKVATFNCKPISDFFGNMTFDQIRIKDIIRFIENRKTKKLTNNSIRREVATFRSLVQRAIDYELIDIYDNKGDYSNDYWIADRLMQNISKFQPKIDKRTIIPTRQNVDDIIDKIESQIIKEFIWCASRIGYRNGELLSLTFGDLDLKNRELKLSDSKTGYPRTTILNNDLYIFFRSLKSRIQKIKNINLDVHPIFNVAYHTLIRTWRKAQIDLGLLDSKGKPLFHIHDLRKISIRYLKETCGYDRDLIMQVYTGHRSEHLFESTYNIKNSDSFVHYKRIILNSDS